MGSYNYFGFGGVDQECVSAVAGTVFKHGISTGSSFADFGKL